MEFEVRYSLPISIMGEVKKIDEMELNYDKDRKIVIYDEDDNSTLFVFKGSIKNTETKKALLEHVSSSMKETLKREGLCVTYRKGLVSDVDICPSNEVIYEIIKDVAVKDCELSKLMNLIKKYPFPKELMGDYQPEEESSGILEIHMFNIENDLRLEWKWLGQSLK